MKSKKLPSTIKKIEQFLQRHQTLTLWTVAIICLLIIISRRYHDFRHPQFWAEDGVVWFQQAYNQGFWHTILIPYSGTLSVTTRIVGSAASLFPIRYAPLIFNLAALLAQLLPIFLINSSRLKSVVRYRTMAILISLLFVCVTNSSEVFVNLTNIQWHLGVAAFLILIADRPKTNSWKIFDAVILILVGLTGPLSLTLLPVTFLIWINNKNRTTLTNLALITATALDQLTSLLLVEPGQRGGAVASGLDAVKMLVGQVFTSGVMGDHFIYTFYKGALPYIALAVGLFITFYAIRKGPRWIGYAQLYALTIFIFMLASLKAVNGSDVWGVLIQQGAGQRYWYIPILAWLATLVWIALAAKNVFMRLICGVLLLLFAFVGVPSSWTIAPRPNQHYSYYVNKFDLLPRGRSFNIPINPEPWSITLNKR